MPVLAINGGTPLMSGKEIKPWPPTEDVDREYVLASLNGSSHAWGPNCNKLQDEWKAWNGNKYCWTTTSGTAALQLALAGCGLSAGDEVLTPAYSWTSSVSCILHQSLIPVFVDIDFATANIDPAKIEAAIGERTRAIICVHLHGLPCDMGAIMSIAKHYKLKVVEDCCQAHGATWQGRKVGTFGDASAFSLNQNKMLSSGEGGLIVTDSEDVWRQAQALVLFGDFREPVKQPDYHAYGLAYMARNNDLVSAYARAQLTRLDRYIADARRLSAVLTGELRGVKGLILPVEPEGCVGNCYNYLIRFDGPALGWTGDMQQLREALNAAICAEGAPAGIWQRRILPEMGCIRARNAYGRGYPWSIPGTRDIDYHPARFPQALRHVDAYTVIGSLRTPNTEETVRHVGQAVRKVLENVKELDVAAIAARADKSIYERGWAQQR